MLSAEFCRWRRKLGDRAVYEMAVWEIEGASNIMNHRYSGFHVGAGI